MTRPPLPPFSEETAILKVRTAEDAWNSRNPGQVTMAYTADSQWRNRSQFFSGRKEIERLFKWQNGRRPDDHPGLTKLGL